MTALLLFPTNKRRRLKRHRFSLFIFLFVLVLVGLLNSSIVNASLLTPNINLQFDTTIPQEDGYGNLKEGQRLFDLQQYDNAAMHYWRAVLFQEASAGTANPYKVEDAFQPFINCFAIQGKIADAFIYVASESFGRGQIPMGKVYLEKALSINPNHPDGLLLKNTYMSEESSSGQQQQASQQQQQQQLQQEVSNPEWDSKTPEELYNQGTIYFQERSYELCADVFELSCIKSNKRLFPSCSNAIYCRNMILDWGFNGTTYDDDIERIKYMVKIETSQFRTGSIPKPLLEEGGETSLSSEAGDNTTNTKNNNNNFTWKRSTSTHPHMMLGYPLEDTMLKRYVAESIAYLDETMARMDATSDSGAGKLKPLPDGLPYDHLQTDLSKFIFEKSESESNNNNYKIRVGFVASGFNSKAVLYLSHDMFRFFDKSKFEIHIFSMGPPDSPLFIEHGMRGVDWRERVKSNVDYFHDVQQLKMDHVALAKFIHDTHKIHILIEWDGYARQGERAQGLFALRPAPIQILHQEYLGTSGAQYVDYIFTDQTVSPMKLQHLYTEKFIYLPNHFFSKGHAVQDEVKKPTINFIENPQKTYKLGTGNPQSNRCMAPPTIGPTNPSIVYCNFNKFLKNNPDTVRSWIRILREVPNSMLCLLENPPEGVPYIRKFIHETAGMPMSSSDSNNNEDTFIHGDGDDLNSRIHFLQWQRNPFDHQIRNQDFCNVMLDSYPYNGHTTAQDALYGGVPIVTRSDGDDMCSRVSTSANKVLNLNELNAYDGPTQYENIAISLGKDKDKFTSIRNKLIGTALQRNPMHPYWDVPRYVKNFENGLQMAWDRYLSGEKPDHIIIEESNDAKRGTYDDVLLNNPPNGKKKVDTKNENMSSSSSSRSNSQSDEL